MKNYCRSLSILVLLSASWARADVISSGATSNPVSIGVSGPIQAQAPTSATTSAISCIDDSGNATNDGTCGAILPKCSDLKSGYETSVKKLLSWKIWGYYKGKNIDLDSSTISNPASPNLVGPTLLYPICSIVGHKMQYSGAQPVSTAGSKDKARSAPIAAYAAAGFEYATQTIGSKATCGKRPDALTGDMAIQLKFSNGAGNLWDSWLIGAYPWLIRRYAYEVLNQIKPDLSNIGDVISDPAVKADMATMNGRMSSFYSNLSSTTKSVCTAAASNIVTKCNSGTMSMTDPAVRLCTLVKAQASINTSALPNMIVKEIMARVQTNYDALFDNLMTFQSGPSAELWSTCKKTGCFLCAGAQKKAASCSCLFDGGEFYANTDDSTPAYENDGSGSSRHRAINPYNFAISNGSVGFGSGSGRTIMMGFGGLVEYIIRHNICQQNAYTDASVCDSVNIPDQPDGAL